MEQQNKIRVIVADDEAPARKKMERLLSNFTDVEIVAFARDGEEALNKTIELTPDILFLDIEMPGFSGIEVADLLSQLEKPPHIIFTTAYEEHAVKAFDLNAVDYLLKPFGKERLQQALDKFKNKGPAIIKRETMQELKTATPTIETHKVPLLIGDRYKLIDKRLIQTIEMNNRLVNIYTGKNHYTLRESLEKIIKKINSPDFFQISRSAVINIKHIKEVVFHEGNRFLVIMNNGRELVCSRDKSKKLRQILNL